MPQISTANALTDFDMCLALAQSSIDTQMEYAWKAWKRRAKFQDTINIFKLKQNGKLIDSQYGLSAKIAPLTISLTVPNARMGQVLVNLKLESGKVVYYDEATESKAEYPVNNWSISFITDLDKKPVDLKALQAVDPAAHAIAQEVIQSTGLPESVFSIEYLFVKLTDINLMLSDNKNKIIPESVPASARNKALSQLELLLERDLGDYVLGTVVRRNTKQATPTFALTDFVFDVQPNWTVARASTLCYLGQFAGRGLPADTSAARLKLTDSWVRPQQLDGTESNVSGIMAIGKDSFLEKYLIPKVQTALWPFGFESAFGVSWGIQSDATAPPPKRSGLSWTFSQSVSGGRVEEGLIRMRLEVDQGFELGLTVQTSSNVIAITGRVWSNIHYYGMTYLAPYKENATEWMHIEGHQDITGELALSGNSIGTDFNLESHLQYKLGDPVMDRNDVGGFAVVTNAFGEVFKALGLTEASPQEALSKVQRAVGEGMRSRLQNALSNLDVDLKQHTFVPPGGGVFTFQNPAFSKSGDLFFDVIYRAP